MTNDVVVVHRRRQLQIESSYSKFNFQCFKIFEDGKVIVTAETITKTNPFRMSKQYGFNSTSRDTENVNDSTHATKRMSFKPVSRVSLEEDNGDTLNVTQRL